MALDIREGDLLTVAGVDYPIRSCAAWAWGNGRAMHRLLKVEASTKRSPAVTAGKRGTPVVNLAGIYCTPLDPLTADLAQRVGLDTPHELLQTYADGGDVYYELVLEDLKR